MSLLRLLPLLILLPALAGPAQARPDPERWAPRGQGHGLREAPPSPARGLGGVVRELEHRSGGRVLAAEPVETGDGLRYRIKLLTPDGRVRVIWVDGR